MVVCIREEVVATIVAVVVIVVVFIPFSLVTMLGLFSLAAPSTFAVEVEIAIAVLLVVVSAIVIAI